MAMNNDLNALARRLDASCEQPYKTVIEIYGLMSEEIRELRAELARLKEPPAASPVSSWEPAAKLLEEMAEHTFSKEQSAILCAGAKEIRKLPTAEQPTIT
jgi:hypothetical protein